MGPGLAILAAVLFALGTVLQQKGTMATGEDDSRFLLHILRRPVWLAGAALQSAGWVVQAAALDRASLVVVQSITALSLVLALPLGVALTSQHIGRRELAGATLDAARHRLLHLGRASPRAGRPIRARRRGGPPASSPARSWASSFSSAATSPARPRR